jgi:prepilin-type processing-associated H-X9-DG protein
VFLGADTAFDPAGFARIADFTDGTQSTILVVEATDPVPWTKAADIPFGPQRQIPALGGLHKGGFHVLWADGSARLVKFGELTDEEIRAAVKRNGREQFVRRQP